MTAIAKIVETAAVFLISPPRARITPREPAPKSKKPGFPGSLDPAKTRLAPRSDLDRLDVRSRRAFRAFDDVEADLLVLFKRLVAFHLDVAVVGEQVLAAVVRRDEPETLGVVEPLHFACSHLLPILSLVTRRIRAPLRARYSRGELTATTGTAAFLTERAAENGRTLHYLRSCGTQCNTNPAPSMSTTTAAPPAAASRSMLSTGSGTGDPRWAGAARRRATGRRPRAGARR